MQDLLVWQRCRHATREYLCRKGTHKHQMMPPLAAIGNSKMEAQHIQVGCKGAKACQGQYGQARMFGKK